MLKKKELNKEEYITELVEVTAMEFYLDEGDASREPFGFKITLPGSTRSPSIVNTRVVTSFQ